MKGDDHDCARWHSSDIARCLPLVRYALQGGIHAPIITEAKKRTSYKEKSPLRRPAADALRRARKLPVGHARNDLRQLVMGLLWLDKKGVHSNIHYSIDDTIMKDEAHQ